jgi:hypothetical protein
LLLWDLLLADFSLLFYHSSISFIRQQSLTSIGFLAVPWPWGETAPPHRKKEAAKCFSGAGPRPKNTLLPLNPVLRHRRSTQEKTYTCKNESPPPEKRRDGLEAGRGQPPGHLFFFLCTPQARRTDRKGKLKGPDPFLPAEAAAGGTLAKEE